MHLQQKLWGLSSAGRASALQAEGHRFEPYRFHCGEIAQLARACGSYPQCRGFESPSRYDWNASEKSGAFLFYQFTRSFLVTDSMLAWESVTRKLRRERQFMSKCSCTVKKQKRKTRDRLPAPKLFHTAKGQVIHSLYLMIMVEKPRINDIILNVFTWTLKAQKNK